MMEDAIARENRRNDLQEWANNYNYHNLTHPCIYFDNCSFYRCR